MATRSEKVKEAEELTDTNPTDRQKERGNYKKGKVTIRGLKIAVENPKGANRSGTDKEGKVWNTKMKNTYGYFRGTVGKDGDPIDVFLGPEVDGTFDVYIVDQVEEDSKAFDEHKVMFGFESVEAAKKAYMINYSKNWKGFGNITTISLNKFKNWISNKDAIKNPAKRLNMIQKVDYKNAAETEEPRMALVKLTGEIKSGESLKGLQERAGDVDSFDTLIVEIASPGGSVLEGLEIMVWLDKLASIGKETVTIVTANAYSIASLIMLAGKTRLISKHGEVMVHNPMVPYLEYSNANDLETYVNELRDLESLMYTIYQMFTGLETEEIKLLMDNETYLKPDEAVNKGFADLVVDIKPRSFEVATNIKTEINMIKTLNILNKVISKVNKSDFVNQLYYDDAGGELEIYQADPSTYSVDDRTNAEDGEYTLSDGAKLTVAGGIITDINREIETPAPDADAEFNEGPSPEKILTPEAAEEDVIEAKVDDVEAKVDVEAKSKEEVEAKAKEDAEAKAKVEVEAKSKEEMDAKAKLDSEAKADEDMEAAAKDDAVDEVKPDVENAESQVEEVIEDSEHEGEEEEVIPVQAPVQAPVEQPVEKSEGINAETLKAFSKLEARIEQLEAERKEILSQFEDLQKFEQLATTAIDTIAENTSSSFKPEARAKVLAPSGGSIFAKSKKAAGLK